VTAEASRATAMRAWGDLNPNAIRVISRILVLVVIWSPVRPRMPDLYVHVGHMSMTERRRPAGQTKRLQ